MIFPCSLITHTWCLALRFSRDPLHSILQAPYDPLFLTFTPFLGTWQQSCCNLSIAFLQSLCPPGTEKAPADILSIRALESLLSSAWQYLIDASSFCSMKPSFLFFMTSCKGNIERCHQKNEKEEIKFQRIQQKDWSNCCPYEKSIFF